MSEEFNLDLLSSSYSVYSDTKETEKNIIRKNYLAKKDKVSIVIENEKLEITRGCLVLNLMIINPFVDSSLKLTKNDLLLNNALSQKDLEKFFNHVLDRFKNDETTDYERVREKIAETLNELTEFSAELNFVAGDTLSFHDFLRLAVEDPEAEEIFKTKSDFGMQFDEIEQRFSDTGKKINEFYKRHPESDLYPFIISKTGLNNKQLTQAIGFVGLKPDINGSVIPVSIDANYLVGLASVENYFINSKGTRKALVTNKTMTKKSGYLTRKLSLLTMDRYHDNNLKDCGTKHFVIYSVDNAKKFSMILNRHYYKLDNDGNKISDELFTVRPEDKEDLLNTKIGLRSPVTCCGKYVCATCYGQYLSEVNKNLNTGLAATFRLTEPLTQRLLSAKHLLSTNTDKINWGEDFLNIFLVNMNSIYFNDIEATVLIPVPNSDDFDEDEEMYRISTETPISILIPENKKPIEYHAPVDLFINPKFVSSKALDEGSGSFIKIEYNESVADDFIFKFQAQNNELIKSLMQILNLIETSEHLGISNYHDFVNKFDDLLIENELDYIPSVHIEMISSTLIRDEETKKRIDFSGDIVPPYKIFRVSKAVMNDPLSISLAFERINEQLIDLNTYKKSESSMLDYLFK